MNTYPDCMIASHSLSQHPDASQYESHCHSCFELLFVLRGEGTYIVEGVRYPLHANTLMLFRPHEYHYVCPNNDAPYERYVINFHRSVPIDEAARLPILSTSEINSRGVYFSSEPLMQKMRMVFSALDMFPELFDQNSLSRATAIRTLVTQALLLLSLEPAANMAASDSSPVVRIIDHINNHLGEDLSLDKLSQEFYISKYHLCRIFRQYTGMPPMNYLTAKRIALAQQLLEQGTPAAETATQVGFHDYSSFYRAFLRQTGHSPTQNKGKI